MRWFVLANAPPLSHLCSLGLTQLRVYCLTEMTQWQLDCDQKHFLCKHPNAETGEQCFRWT